MQPRVIAIALTIACGAWAFPTMLSDDPVTCGIALIPSLILGLLVLTNPRLTNPVVWAFVSVFIGVSLRTIYYGLADSSEARRILGNLILSDLRPGIVATSFASLGVAIGYLLVGNFRIRLNFSPPAFLKREWTISRLVVISIPVAMVALAAEYFLLRDSGFNFSFSDLSALSAKRHVELADSDAGYSSYGYHRLAAGTLPFALYLVWFIIHQTKRTWTTLGFAAIFFLITAVVEFLNSSRTGVILVIVNGMIIMAAHGKLKFRTLAISGLAIAAVLSVMLMFRRNQVQSLADATKAFEIMPIADSVIANQNFTDIITITKIYESVPELIGYKYGSTYFTWIYAPIPRSLWPGKPNLSQGLEITEEIYNDGGGNPPSLVGEAILNFGVYAVPFIAILHGVLMRLVFNTYLASKESKYALALYLCALLPVGFELTGGESTRTVLLVIKNTISVGSIFFLAGLPRFDFRAR